MYKPLSSDLLNTLSAKYGNAFYLLETERFEQNYIELSTAFKTYYPKFNIAYSLRFFYTRPRWSGEYVHESVPQY